MEKESLSYTTLKNASYTFINYAFPILFSIFITPVVVHRLGVEDYGVYVLVNTIIGFLGLLDLGLSSAMLKFMSEYWGRKDFVSLQKLINSANSLFLIIGLLSLAAFLVIGAFFLPWFNIGSASTSHILVVFALAGTLSFLNAINSIYSIVPPALLRFDISTKTSLAQLTFFNVSILVAVLLGYKLKVVLVLNLVSVLALTVYLRYVFKKLLPGLNYGFGWDKAEIKKSYGFGLLAAVSNTANSFLTQLDRLIIPMYMNTAQLSYYSLPGNVAQKTPGITGALSGVLFPLASNVSGQGLEFKLADIYRKTFRNLTVLAAACTIAMAAFSYKILYFWLGKEFADQGSGILVILAFTYFLLSLFGVLTNFLMGMNKVKFLAVWSIIMAVVNVVLLFTLLPKEGIVGAAWAYFGAAALVPMVFFFAEKMYFKFEGQWAFYAKLYAKIIVTSLVFWVAMKYGVEPFVNSITSLIVVGPLTVLFFLLLYKLFGFFETEDWNLFISFWLKIKEKIWKSSPTGI